MGVDKNISPKTYTKILYNIYMKKLIKVSSILAILLGIVLTIGGVWGIYFTYKNVAREKIITPADANISGKPVLGPLTLRAQSDAIRKHTLLTTEDKTFAEMPRQIQEIGKDGKPILDEKGDPIMTPNMARDIWITATTLTTALNLAILVYAFSTLITLFGIILIWIGVIFYTLNNKL